MNKPKKSLGQNFLTSVGAVNKIIDAAEFDKGLAIIEVGPGRGVLTEALLKKFDKVIAVEKDHDLITPLKEKFADEIAANKLEIVEGDILEKEIIESLFWDAEREESEACDEAVLTVQRGTNVTFDKVMHPKQRFYAMVANIPYYITGQFLRQWLAIDNPPKYMVLMLQKEVAQRIVAKDGKESILSMSVKAYGEPKYIETVKRGSFYPIPNVDSAILKIDKISKAFFGATNRLDDELPSKENHFFEILKAGFAHKRKYLIKNLETELFNKETIKTAFNICGLDTKSRAEDLKLSDWRCLTQNLN